MNPSFEKREFFHLILLRHLALRLIGKPYALKGGICLRFFHRSPRLSEDMDLDVVSRLSVATLKNAVDTVLASRAFLSSLLPHGILRLDVRQPKQTETTQRWKIQLILSHGSLSTKIEFSRRAPTISSVSGIPGATLLARYGLIPFAVPYYDAPTLVVQKIRALASPSRLAVRDAFDLHHLFYTVEVPSSALAKRIPREDIESALEKVDHFRFVDFSEQVTPCLTETLITLYRDRVAFEKLKDEVQQKLLELLP